MHKYRNILGNSQHFPPHFPTANGPGVPIPSAIKSSLFPGTPNPVHSQTPKAHPLTTEQELRQRLRKIAALFEGATTPGERDAAEAAIKRVRAAIAATERTEKPIEMNFRLPDRWNRRLFTALCRRYGLHPYRYPRQRYSTVVLRAPASFLNGTLWPEFLQIKTALDEYLHEATERIIREEVFGNSEEAEEQPGTPQGTSPTMDSVADNQT